MKQIVTLMLAGLFYLALTGCEGPVWHSYTVDEALAAARDQKKVVMIDFGATWCGPCQKMDATTFQDPEVQKFIREHTIAIKVDVDENRHLANRYGVAGLPTILFLDSDGYELDRLTGLIPTPHFLAAAREILETP
jgi:thiol:disulfide interchange protein